MVGTLGKSRLWQALESLALIHIFNHVIIIKFLNLILMSLFSCLARMIFYTLKISKRKKMIFNKDS